MAQVNYLGYTPWCPTPTSNASDVGVGTYYPCAFAGSEICQFFWSVRTWKATITSSATETADSSGICPQGVNLHGSASGSVYLAIGGQIPLTSELQLVCQSTFPVYSLNGAGLPNPTYSGTQCTGQITRNDAPHLSVTIGGSCKYYNYYYYPYINVSGLALGNWSQKNPVSVSGLTSTLSCKIYLNQYFPKPITIYNNWTPSNSTLQGFAATSNHSIVISPASYWSYNP